MSKLEKFKRAIKASIAFNAISGCYNCPIGKQCDSTIEDGLLMNGVFCGCPSVFLAAVIAGIIDLDGTPIKEDER